MNKCIKYSTLTVAFIFISLTNFAQTLVKESIIWSVADFPTEARIINTTHTKFEGNSMINGKTFKKIWTAKDVSISQWEFYRQYIREEGGIVYYYNGNVDIEHVLYDFNLAVGDTFYFEGIDENMFVVDSIKTLDVQGQLLKHWYLRNFRDTSLFIEKIGSYYGVKNPFGNQYTGATFELLCVTENGEYIYNNPNYNSCHLNRFYTGVESMANDGFVQVFLNENIYIQLDSNNYLKGTITFYDTNGKEVLKETISHPTTLLCLPVAGILIYRFLGENGKSQTGKIVIPD